MGKGKGGEEEEGRAEGGVSAPDQSVWLFLFFFFYLLHLSVKMLEMIVLTSAPLFCVSSQKSPAKKLSHALSKSLSCASSREPLHPMFPEMPDKPLNLAHIV